MDTARYIGKRLPFAFEPYHTGVADIESVRPNMINRTEAEGPWPGKYTVTFRVIEGKERNRLFQYVSYGDMAGKELVIYSASEADLDRWIERGFIRYVYPV